MTNKDTKNDVGFFIMYNEGIRTLQDELTAIVGPELCKSVLFRYGYKCGRMSAGQMGLIGHGKKALEYLAEAWIGLGLARPLSIKENGSEIIVRLSDTLESSHGGTGCDFTRGFLGGMMSGITNIPYHCVERKCVSKKDKECVFALMENQGQGGR